MKKVVVIMMSGVAALALAVSLGAPVPAAQRAPAGETASAALITAWRCPITDQFFASPFTCKNNCFGFTCQAVSQ